LTSAFHDTSRSLQRDQRSAAIARSNAHGPRCILDQVDFETRFQGIQRRRPHADIQRQAAEPKPPNSLALQFPREPRIGQRRIFFAIAVGPFADYAEALGELKPRMKSRTARALDAMC